MRRWLASQWLSRGLPQRGVIVLIGFGLLALLAVLILKWAPEWLATGGLPDRTARAEEVGRTRTAVLAALAGLIAVTGAIFTGLSYRLNRAGQITERFTRAIDQLGNVELDVRLGGIYALERIARDSKDDHPQVMEVLTAYVREHAPWPPMTSAATNGGQHSETLTALTEAIRALERIAKGNEPDGSPPAPRRRDEPTRTGSQDERRAPATDVQAVMDVLGRRIRRHDRGQLNLARTDLRGVVLGHDHHFEYARLDGAHLEGANLQNVHLDHASLQEAHLEGAWLHFAHLEGAVLQWAHLEGAMLNLTHLENGACNGAHFEGAIFAKAHVRGASLRGAHFEGARITDPLEGAHLDGATFDDATDWPNGFDPRAAGARHVNDVDEDQEPDTVPPSA